MEVPKFEPTAPPPPQTPPPTPHPAATAEALQEEGVDRQRAAADEIGALSDKLAQTEEVLAQAKRILRDLVAAGVLTDGFMTIGVGQCLLNQAEAAKKFLADHP